MTSLASAKNLSQARENYRSRNLPPPSYTAIIIKAVGLTLKKFPELNRVIIGPPLFRRIVQLECFDINVAVEKNLPHIPGQAYAPCVRNVDQRGILDISAELKFYSTCTEADDKNLKAFMRVLKFAPWPLGKWILNLPCWFASFWIRFRGGACWVNSPSKSGADLVLTTWPWPVTFSFGVVQKRPWVNASGEVVAENTIPLVLVFDRRLMGGGPAGRIFAEFKRLIEDADPELFSEPEQSSLAENEKTLDRFAAEGGLKDSTGL